MQEDYYDEGQAEMLAYEEAEQETEDDRGDEENGGIYDADNFGSISGRNAFREKLRAQLDQLNSGEEPFTSGLNFGA